MNKLDVREYKTKDSKSIYELFDKFTPYPRDDKFWVWINRMLSDEKSIIVVGESNEEIIGHYAIIPKKVIINNIMYTAGFAIHAFVHPNFRNTFLIFQITKKIYKIAKDKKIDFLYGFANENFRDIQVKADKWKKVSLFSSLEKDALKIIDSSYTLQEITNNYSDYYLLSEIIDSQLQKLGGVEFIKNLNYYINRYLNHPHKLYKCFFINKNDEKCAFVILKIYINDNKKVGHLIDYIKTESISFTEVLNIVENYFYSRVDKLSFWKFCEEDKIILLNNGFVENGFETFLGIKTINNIDIEEKLLNFRNWKLCMGDSDAF